MTQNRRSSFRHPVDLTINIAHEGNEYASTLMNLSLGGALLHHEGRLPLGATLNLSFEIPTQEHAVEVQAHVRWASDDALGVQFEALRARDVWSLNKYFERFENDE